MFNTDSSLKQDVRAGCRAQRTAMGVARGWPKPTMGVENISNVLAGRQRPPPGGGVLTTLLRPPSQLGTSPSTPSASQSRSLASCQAPTIVHSNSQFESIRFDSLGESIRFPKKSAVQFDHNLESVCCNLTTLSVFSNLDAR